MATQSNEVQVQIGDEVKILEGDELIAFNNMRAEIEAEGEARKAEAEAKAQAKAAAEGKLSALGLTTNDLRALGL
jgi:regulator of protease activity HflC (stomatin/prohibitin superfamily)